MKTKNFKIILTTLIILTITSTLFSACGKKEEPVPETVPETTAEIKIQEMPKITEDHAKIPMETPPARQKTDDELITDTLLNHYGKEFTADDYDIQSTGYKMYLIEDVGSGLKRAYGWASYWCYNIDNDELKLQAGAGTTQVALEFSTDGQTKKVIYEVLTDDQQGDAEFNKIFPESIRPQLLKRDQNDMDEVEKKQEEMAKRLYKEKTGKEYTKALKKEVVKCPASTK